MLYYLSLLSEKFGPLRLFEYVTFRAGGALFTAFLLVALLGSPFAAMLRKLNIRFIHKNTQHTSVCPGIFHY